MGDVLVYIEETAIDDGRATRLLGWARPLADAAGGSLVALVASADGVSADRLPAADVVLSAQHPALSPYLPEAHQATLVAAIAARTPDAVVLENTTSGWDLGAASAASASLAFVGYCHEVTIEGGTDAPRAVPTAASCSRAPRRRCRRCSLSTRQHSTTSRWRLGAARPRRCLRRRRWTT